MEVPPRPPPEEMTSGEGAATIPAAKPVVSVPLPERGVQGPSARACEHEIDEGEREQYRCIALVRRRPEAIRHVEQEIGDGHLAGADERRDAREQTRSDKGSADCLDQPAEKHDWRQRVRDARLGHRETKEQDQPVLEKEQPRHDPDDREGLG